MGALDAFSKAFSLVAENKKVYVLVLVTFIGLNLLNFGLFVHINAGISTSSSVKETMPPSVLFKEYGSTSHETVIPKFEYLLLSLLVAIMVLSLVEYSVVKAYYLSTEGKSYSFLGLIEEGLRKILGVIAVNLLAYLVVAVIVLIPVGILLIGSVTLNIPLVFVGLFILVALIPVLITYFSLVVPAYVETERIGVFLDALKLTFRHFLSSFGYGVLVIVLAFAVAIAMTPVLLLVTLAGAGPLWATLIEAPFDAFLTCFLWAGGVFLYRDFKGIEGRKEEFLY